MTVRTDLEDAFTRFVNEYRVGDEYPYQQQLSGIGYKGTTPLIVDFNDLYNHDADLGMHLVEHPKETLKDFGSAVKNRIHVRNLPLVTPIRLISSAQIGNFIMVSGIVVKAYQDTSRISRAAFMCLTSSCGYVAYMEQPNQYLRRPDERCPECKGNRWEINFDKTAFRDSQLIALQESPDQLPPGEIPRRLEIVLNDELVKSANPGDRVNVTGTVTVKLSNPTSQKLELERFLIANHVEVLNKEDDSMNLTDRERLELEELSKEPNIARRLVKSVAPSIYGYEDIKKAIALQLFGAPPIEKPDVRIRGDINILLVGDPGTAKSQILKFAASASSRGIYTTGGGASRAGLTAAVLKEKDGGVYLEAGALVLADTGLCAIDEGEKMDEEDRSAIHPALEQQIVAVAKAGIIATLNARCSVLMAANPNMGRYNTYQTVAENINKLPVTLLNRFDLIFIMLDKPEENKDQLTGEKIMGLSEEGSIQPLDFKTLKRYVGYSKSVNPAMSEEISRRLVDYYVSLRRSSQENQAIMITPRQLESLIRLTKAHARMHLRGAVNDDDVLEAVALFEASMRQVGVDPETGKIDIDTIMTGKPRGLQIRLGVLLETIVASSDSSVDGAAHRDELLEAAKARGIKEAELEKLLGVLIKDGTIFSPRPNLYRRAS